VIIYRVEPGKDHHLSLQRALPDRRHFGKQQLLGERLFDFAWINRAMGRAP